MIWKGGETWQCHDTAFWRSAQYCYRTTTWQGGQLSSSSRKRISVRSSSRSWGSIHYLTTSSQTLIILIGTITILLLGSSYYALLGFTAWVPSSVSLLRVEEQQEYGYANGSSSSLEQTNEEARTTLNITNGLSKIIPRRQNSNNETALESKIRNIHRPQKVFVLPNLTDIEAKGELSHFILDGINRSSVLQRTFDMYDTDDVWVVDLVRF